MDEARVNAGNQKRRWKNGKMEKWEERDLLKRKQKKGNAKNEA